MPLYALLAPGGLVEQTVSHSISDAWHSAFGWFCDNGCGNLLPINHDGQEREECPPAKSRYFQRRFWRRADAMKGYAKRHGYAVVEVSVIIKMATLGEKHTMVYVPEGIRDDVVVGLNIMASNLGECARNGILPQTNRIKAKRMAAMPCTCSKAGSPAWLNCRSRSWLRLRTVAGMPFGLGVLLTLFASTGPGAVSKAGSGRKTSARCRSSSMPSTSPCVPTCPRSRVLTSTKRSLSSCP